MFIDDIEELVREEGLHPDKMGVVIEIALVALRNTKTKEGKYLQNILEGMRDECESCELTPEDVGK